MLAGFTKINTLPRTIPRDAREGADELRAVTRRARRSRAVNREPAVCSSG